jgi:murein L,D-transpeptidase YcbB/YkuD
MRGRDGITVYGALRASALLLAFVAAAACANNTVKPAPMMRVVAEPSPLSRTQSALRSVFESRKSPSPADSVFRFYEARDFLPAWNGSPDANSAAGEVRTVLAHAHDQGLRDEDYKLSQPNSPPAAGSEAAEYDVAITAALLRYARDVKTGRINPDDIFNDVLLPLPNFNAAAQLTAALKDHALTAFLADLPPAHPEYRALAKSLAVYRTIADEGGWPSLPGSNEIRLDRNDARLGALVKRLAFEDPILAAIAMPAPADIREAVKRFQLRNGLDGNGRVAGETLTALNVPAAFRLGQIAANMERWRWMPEQFETRYIAVNVPDQSVTFVRDGTVALTSRVIVGRKGSPTPIVRSEIVAVVANPPWNIPGDIAARDLLPHLRKSANYLYTKHMVVTDGPPGDPYGRTIDWKKIVPADFPYAIRQLPGPATALGAVMLDSPNDFDVYLHDTPNKKFFDSSEREISNGCVRVQQIVPLASLVMTGDANKGLGNLNQAIKSHQTQRLALDHPMPVYFLYWSAMPAADGTVSFRPDRYGRDATLIGALTKTLSNAPLLKMQPDKMQAEPMDSDDPSP